VLSCKPGINNPFFHSLKSICFRKPGPGELKGIRDKLIERKIIDGWMDGKIDRQTDRCIDRWMDGWMDGCIDR
jgi:hypothetical protein